MNRITELVKRQIIIHYKLLAGKLPLVLIIFATFFLFPTAAERFKGIIIILGFSINLFFGMTFFSQTYLQELKDNELGFLLTFLVDMNKIILSKAAYILTVILFLNILIIIPELVIINNIVASLNVFIANIIIGSLSGGVFLFFSLKFSYETFLNFNQYLKGVIMISFFLIMALLHNTAGTIGKGFQFNPLFSLGFLFLLSFLYLKLLQVTFNKD